MTSGKAIVRVAATRMALGLLVALIAACDTANSQIRPSASVSTLMSGWEQHFTLDWGVEPEPGDTRRISGYVYNRNGKYAEPLRVLAQAFDDSGIVIAQDIAWLPGGVGGFGRRYFEIRHLPAAASYKVTVWDYTWRRSNTSS
jgi:hypothetical protein